MNRVLLFANGSDDKYVGNLVREVTNVNPNISFDLFDICTLDHPCTFISHLSEYYFARKHFFSFLYLIPKVRAIFYHIDFIWSVEEIVRMNKKQGKRYNVCNFQYLLPKYNTIIKRIRTVSNYCIASPWGSDILRANEKDLQKLRKFVNHNDYVTAPKGYRFEDDIKEKLLVRENKLYDILLGDKIIDTINKNKYIDTIDAKSSFGLKDFYVITCGYNASEAQNHLSIINSINTIVEKLPSNYCLLFPMTYGNNNKDEYIKVIRSKLDELCMTYKIIDTYLTEMDVCRIRVATDVFIHAQTTDAACGTVTEYLLCNKKILNAVWLKYPQRERFGTPFYTFNTFDDLPHVLLEAINAKKSIINPLLISDISREGWCEKAHEWSRMYMM